jgi:hypothetical protein
MNKLKAELSFVLTYQVGTGKCKQLTRISVRIGGIEVAWKVVGLKWTKDQAAKEWRLNPKSFKMTDAAGALTLVGTA